MGVGRKAVLLLQVILEKFNSAQWLQDFFLWL
jgi:hypothetical protein